MHKLLVFAALLACVLAAPTDITITHFLANADLDGSYAYEVAQDNGASFSEQGLGGVEAHGSYSYISPEGLPVSVTYEADANGFRPQSDLLPTSPPIPEAILRSLRYIEEHPTPEELADRQVRAQQI